MNFKQRISKLVAEFFLRRGLVLIPVDELKIQLRKEKNFESLCSAYEFRVNEEGGASIIPGNAERWRLLSRQHGTPPSEAYIVIQALHRALPVDGEVCEFGVAQGEFSAVLAEEIRGSGKTLHLFDSFEGLPKPTHEDVLKDDVLQLGSMEAYAGQMSNPESLVRRRLAEINFSANRFQVHKGYFAELVVEKRDFPSAVCFAYVDFDLYQPIKEVLRYLDSVSSGGAVFVVDDYDYFSTGAKKAVDEFLAEKNASGLHYSMKVAPKELAHCAILSKLL